MGLRKIGMSRELSHSSEIDTPKKLIDKICLICSEFANAGFPEPEICLGDHFIYFESVKPESLEECKIRLEKELNANEKSVEYYKQKLEECKQELESLG